MDASKTESFYTHKIPLFDFFDYPGFTDICEIANIQNPKQSLLQCKSSAQNATNGIAIRHLTWRCSVGRREEAEGFLTSNLRFRRYDWMEDGSRSQIRQAAAGCLIQ